MVYYQLGMILLAVMFLWLFITVLLPPVLVIGLNAVLIGLAAWQARERWVHKAHYWYEMGLLFSFIIVMFYPNILPFWPITNFCILAVAIAELLQIVEKQTIKVGPYY